LKLAKQPVDNRSLGHNYHKAT